MNTRGLNSLEQFTVLCPFDNSELIFCALFRIAYANEANYYKQRFSFSRWSAKFCLWLFVFLKKKLMTRNKSRGKSFQCVLIFRFKYIKLDDKYQRRAPSCLNPNTISPKLDRHRKHLKYNFEFAKFQKQFVLTKNLSCIRSTVGLIYFPSHPSPTKNYLSPYILQSALTGLLEHANINLTEAIDRFLGSPVLFL